MAAPPIHKHCSLPISRASRAHHMAAAHLPLLLFLQPLLLTWPSSSAQQIPDHALPPRGGGDTKANPVSMAIIIVLIAAAFFFMAFFSLYCRLHRGYHDSPTPALEAARSRVRPIISVGRFRTGLDPAAIDSFPKLVYSDVRTHRIGTRAPLQCAVCLYEFSDEDVIRLLPKCSHAFHPDCIDKWLSSKTTCPVCRAYLVSDSAAPSPPPTTMVELEAASMEQLSPTEESDVLGEESEPAVEEAVITLQRDQRRVPARSYSTTAAVGDWTELERERFTLRLPEEVKRELMAGRMRRSSSAVAALEAGEWSFRRGYRGRSGSGGWSFRMGRWDSGGRSGRLAALARSLSIKALRSGGCGSSGGGSRRSRGDRSNDEEWLTSDLARV